MRYVRISQKSKPFEYYIVIFSNILSRGYILRLRLRYEYLLKIAVLVNIIVDL